MPPQEPPSTSGIKWNKVTWYSQLLAILLGVVIFFVGFFLGTLSTTKYSSHNETNPVESKKVKTEFNEISRTNWVAGSEYALNDLTFEYPENWEVTAHGTNQSDEAVSALFLEGDGETVVFLKGGEAALIEGCKGVTFLANNWSPTVERIFNSAKCLEH